MEGKFIDSGGSEFEHQLPLSGSLYLLDTPKILIQNTLPPFRNFEFSFDFDLL